MAKTERTRGRQIRGSHTACLPDLGSGALSLTDPTRHPPLVVTGSDNGLKGTLGLLGLSRVAEDSLPAVLVGCTYSTREHRPQTLDSNPLQESGCAVPRAVRGRTLGPNRLGRST
jgi:hypothetical protein